ncbi:MAG: hypothetical protein RMX68_005725 [Aulosira sp. ZfuVER01]|nr:hypothetical protein [Aulosira sp. ZfuVER01]MDZ7998856.1 hypothetical protein [Aulosira sp. DedVER01a]MDZ8056101.1 hypothetical protein [Aulosira sp. ZfuCHP01]
MSTNILAPYLRHYTTYLFSRLIPQQKIYICSWLLSKLFTQLSKLKIFALLFGIKIHNICPLTTTTEVFLRIILSSLYKKNLENLNIRIKDIGIENLLNIYQKNNKVIICSVHFPLNRSIFYTIQASKIPYAIIGHSQPDRIEWDAETADYSTIKPSPYALINAKKELLSDKVILCMIDKYFGSDSVILSSNLLKFAQLSHTPIMFFATKLLENGEILTYFYTPKKPILSTNEDFEDCKTEFVNFLNIFSSKKIPIYFN